MPQSRFRLTKETKCSFSRKSGLLTGQRPMGLPTRRASGVSTRRHSKERPSTSVCCSEAVQHALVSFKFLAGRKTRRTLSGQETRLPGTQRERISRVYLRMQTSRRDSRATLEVSPRCVSASSASHDVTNTHMQNPTNPLRPLPLCPFAVNRNRLHNPANSLHQRCGCEGG
ncbi:hypothetical protein DES53_10246 [Roseimicrobium gellanilyticum]|uniref:Uncharacterized protein n=1 Tax=Roseimicrobium gellanilyticum TaxID=748857 RepID=A0A366HRW2_9BACT|nr:hypothetical protein DES53_10246 [Roseimicrobium gellanilyticum]